MSMFLKRLIVVFAPSILLACGGGSDSSGSNPPINFANPGDSNQSSNTPTFTRNNFAASSDFKDRCENPRSGTNPATNQAFADKKGSTLEEKFWLRSWSNELYLWYDEIDDQDPADFSTAANYFEVLKTDATTASGNPRDKFHFIVNTEEWRQRSQSGVSAGYGARILLTATRPPRRAVVAYVQAGTPAADAGLKRGAEILTIDGVDLINGSDVDTLNGGLRPSAGESHEFSFRNVGADTNTTATIRAANITTQPVLKTDVIDTSSGKVGYMLFNTHIATAEQQLIDAIKQFDDADIDDIVLDLRYNGGGLLALAAQLGYMVAGPTASANATFEKLVFNDKHTVTNPVTGDRLEPIPFINETLGFSADEGQALPNLGLSRVFVLTTAATCSASESIINGLRGIDLEVVQIGETTCGKPYGFYPTDNCGDTYFTIQFAGENNKGFSDFSDGFSPSNATDNKGVSVAGCAIADDFTKALGDSSEAMLAAALGYRTSRSCPAANTVTTTSQQTRGGIRRPSETGPALEEPVWLNSKIMGLPNG